MNDPSIPIEYGPAQSRPSTWPTTFGVIAIVFGIIGLLFTAWGIVVSIVMSTSFGETDFFSAAGGGPNELPEESARMLEAMTENLERWSTMQMVTQILLLLLAILLLVGGILLLNRRPLAPRLLMIWSYAKIVAGIGSAFVGYQMQRGQMRAMQETMNSAVAKSSAAGGSPTAIPATFGTMMDVFTGIFFFIGVIWVCALPVVFLIWLNRSVVQADIATWGGGPAKPDTEAT